MLNVGNYLSTEAYNEARQRERLAGDVYPDDENFDWQWDSDENRREYGDYWRRRNLAGEIALFAMGGMVLNRIISVIDASYQFGMMANSLKVSLQPVAKKQEAAVVLTLAYNF